VGIIGAIVGQEPFDTDNLKIFLLAPEAANIVQETVPAQAAEAPAEPSDVVPEPLPEIQRHIGSHVLMGCGASVNHEFMASARRLQVAFMSRTFVASVQQEEGGTWPTRFTTLLPAHASNDASARFFQTDSCVEHSLPMVPLIAQNCGASMYDDARKVFSLCGQERNLKINEIERLVVVETMKSLDAQQEQIKADLKRGKFSMRTELLDKQKIATPTGMIAH